MSKKIIYSTRPFRQEFITQIATIAPEFSWQTTLKKSQISDVEIMLGWDRELESELLTKDSNLRWVQSISAGVDYLPLEQLSKNNVLLSNASGLHRDSISQHVLGVILSDYRGIHKSALNQEQHLWKDSTMTYRTLEQANLLIIGTGKIGQRLAELATPFGPTIFGINTSGHKLPNFKETYPIGQLHEVLPDMDIVVNILPLTPETTGLFNAQLFSVMNPEALFINVGRGKSVVTEDLIAALNKQQFRFAALDVFEEEPLPDTSPLWMMDNVLVTPHLSGMTPNFQEKFMQIFLENLKSYHKEQKIAINQVNLNKGY
ncbi:hydroxyacid dehydrogenase [Enterococcus sp. JM4C]|uniref:phosphoglycerate dehydrogenase n=1 Tax=Candidatus Enterococcus huntleyi TaxID=1857217 RepID=UPI00137AD934|nr:phosphoglycerate dehydrogenase [Enterococcus sp. JM4C]KAF1297243.1 hydroxyacid dehydrogenase [Enterococcus sp. JM4C]